MSRNAAASALFVAAIFVGAPGSPVAAAPAASTAPGSPAAVAPVNHGATTSGPVVQLGYQMAGQAPFRWTGSQDTCLNYLWTRESGWRKNATNAESGAYGIAQSLHGNVGGQGGNEYSETDPEGLTPAQLQAANNGSAPAQILWGLRYILGQYGTPCSAWDHEEDAGWY